MSVKKLPQSFKPFLWSYDFSKLDVEKNKKVIIENVLNLGTFVVSKELFKVYSVGEIKEVLNKMKPSLFNKKSINYWNKILS